MGQDSQNLPLGKTIGDAVRDLVRKRWPNNAAKLIEREWGLDPKTAKNVVSAGNVSERTLTKAIRAEGWGFLEALGREVTGESYADHLTRIIERDSLEQRRRVAERDRVRQVERELADLL